MSINIQTYPQCGTVAVANGSTYAGANLVTFPAPCIYLQLTETTNHAVTCQLNGSSTARIPVAADGTVTIPVNAMVITSIDFANSSGTNASVNYIAGLTVG